MRSVLQDHHLGSLHNGSYLVTLLKFSSSALRRVITLSRRLSPTRTTTCAIMSPSTISSI
jgi:hypothetical protein